MKNENKDKKPGSGKRTLLTVFCVILAVILILLIAATAFLEGKMGLLNRTDGNSTLSSEDLQDFLNSQTDPSASGPTIDPDDIDWGNQGDEPVKASDDIINILLIGQDSRSNSLSDSMILCSINKPAKTINVISFMRDMYVQIPGYYDHKLNTSYALGGMKTLNATLAENFGIHIDGNVEVDFSGFIDVIDVLGGVDVELTSSEASYLNRRGNWDLNNSTAGQWSLREGVNHLTGEQALAYCRIRYIGNGDYGRTERQRKVLFALMEEAKDLSITKLNTLLNEVLPMLTTDLSNSEIVGYALEVFPLFSDLTMSTHQIPTDDGHYAGFVKEMAVLVPDLDVNRQYLEDLGVLDND